MNGEPNRILDELAKLMTNAAGAAKGVSQEMETFLRSQVEQVLNQLDLVKREEFDVVKQMASLAQSDKEELSRRVEALETQLSAIGKTPPAGDQTK